MITFKHLYESIKKLSVKKGKAEYVKDKAFVQFMIDDQKWNARVNIALVRSAKGETLEPQYVVFFKEGESDRGISPVYMQDGKAIHEIFDSFGASWELGDKKGQQAALPKMAVAVFAVAKSYFASSAGQKRFDEAQSK